MEVACVLIPELSDADPVEAGEATERLLRRLEGVGAAVESERAGEAFFAVDGLRGIHGGETAGVLEAVRRVAETEVRIGLGPTRFDAFVAARGERPPVSVSLLKARIGLPPREADDLIETMRRLGIETLEALAPFSADRVSDRFGPPGLRALRLARGEDSPLRPRHPHEELVAEIELPEGTAGSQLDRAMKLLIDRLLAAPQRRERTVLGLRLGARLSGGGSWSVDQGLGSPTASARTICSVLTPRLEALPGPAAALRLQAVGLGPRVGDQLELAVRGGESRRRRLRDAVREVRVAQGVDSLLEVLPVDAASRVPERWAVLTPTPDR